MSDNLQKLRLVRIKPASFRNLSERARAAVQGERVERGFGLVHNAKRDRRAAFEYSGGPYPNYNRDRQIGDGQLLVQCPKIRLAKASRNQSQAAATTTKAAIKTALERRSCVIG